MSSTHPIARIVLLVLWLAWLSAAAAQAPSTHQHGFGNAERWAQVFDDPERDAWQKPDEVIAALDLAPDAVVADIGAGTGYFAVRLARAVPQGRVYAVDIERDMVRYLTQRARHERLDNVAPIAGEPDDPKLPERVDLVLTVDTYHHIEDRSRYFRDLKGSLEPGGRVAIIDFRLDSPIGPPRSTRMAPEQVVRELEAAGYRLASRHDFLPNQYFLVFEPAS